MVLRYAVLRYAVLRHAFGMLLSKTIAGYHSLSYPFDRLRERADNYNRFPFPSLRLRGSILFPTNRTLSLSKGAAVDRP